ncbi:Hypothetical protein CINCED_3A012861 [Cinara cedri]|uniref:Tc1-like transposase DDE domain-containing protein n=1 Tax=Cinara cedri TaxID=506608 RepID=A0A5E4NCS8_9HEMI|nr:Hypothetical protein CINCED_3A012861 [Cinara cedri]
MAYQDTHSQTKKVIFHVYNYFKTLAGDKGNPKISNFFRQTREMTAEACGVSVACVKRVCAEGKKLFVSENQLTAEPSLFKSSKKSYKRAKPMTNLDDFDNDVVRRTVHSFYDNGQYPTSEKILEALHEKINYSGSQWSVRHILHETWANQNHTQGHIWQNSDNTEELKVPIGNGGWLIVCHAGSTSFGFVKNSKLVFRLKSGSQADYHSQMNVTIFHKWIIDMLGNLEEPCIIVTDNVTYHSTLTEKYPKANTQKADVQKWLQGKSVDFSPVETLSELREKVKLTMSKEKKYKLDEIALQMGHKMVRLPPYHCQYNPIKLIWAQVKGKVAEKNNTFKMADIEVLVNSALDAITAESWAKCG